MKEELLRLFLSDNGFKLEVDTLSPYTTMSGLINPSFTLKENSLLIFREKQALCRHCLMSFMPPSNRGYKLVYNWEDPDFLDNLLRFVRKHLHHRE